VIVIKEPVEITIKHGGNVYRIPSTDCRASITVRSIPIETMLWSSRPTLLNDASLDYEATHRVEFAIHGSSDAFAIAFGVRERWWKRWWRSVRSAVVRNKEERQGT
jgi:hypothetical protein